MSKIMRVLPKEDHCLEIVLDNGSSVNLSLKYRLETIRFGMLAARGVTSGTAATTFSTSAT